MKTDADDGGVDHTVDLSDDQLSTVRAVLDEELSRGDRERQDAVIDVLEQLPETRTISRGL